MKKPNIICIGSVLWDMIGRTELKMLPGYDNPGRIVQEPGGVAMNIAMTLRKLGARPLLLSIVGQDASGDMLMRMARQLGLDMEHVTRSAIWPTDRYMAIEGPDGVVAAIADAHSLEAAGETILAPLRNGTLGDAKAPWSGPIAVDGNLMEDVLRVIAKDPAFAAADLRVAPASPGKVQRLRVLRDHPCVHLYVNRIEAEILLDRAFEDAAQAAQALVAEGWTRALVTDGPGMTADMAGGECITETPPKVVLRRATGAGDTFMAGHIAAEMANRPRAEALHEALYRAARFVSGEDNV